MNCCCDKNKLLKIIGCLIAIILLVIAASRLLTKKEVKKPQSLPQSQKSQSAPKPTRTQEITLSLKKEVKAEETSIEVILQTSFIDIIATAVGINYSGNGQVTVKPNQKLILEGWQFPVSKATNNRIEFMSLLLKNEPVDFSNGVSLATITIKTGKVTENQLTFDQDLTKISRRTGQTFLPTLNE